MQLANLKTLPPRNSKPQGAQLPILQEAEAEMEDHTNWGRGDGRRQAGLGKEGQQSARGGEELASSSIRCLLGPEEAMVGCGALQGPCWHILFGVYTAVEQGSLPRPGHGRGHRPPCLGTLPRQSLTSPSPPPPPLTWDPVKSPKWKTCYNSTRDTRTSYISCHPKSGWKSRRGSAWLSGRPRRLQLSEPKRAVQVQPSLLCPKAAATTTWVSWASPTVALFSAQAFPVLGGSGGEVWGSPPQRFPPPKAGSSSSIT